MISFSGAMYCWGNNSSGQLGNGTTTNSTTPSLVAGGLVFSAVSVGGKHVCGEIVGNIDLYCWGDNSSGQLGNGTMTNSSVPVPVTTGIYNILMQYPSAGASHTCAGAAGHNGFEMYSAAVCWGDNSSGQLGNGTTTNSAVPVATNTYVGPQFSAGTLFTCAYTAALPGVSCFGNNGSGQLGNGTTTNSPLPVIVASALTFETVSAGDSHTCGLSLYGIAFCWGNNSSEQLGNGTTTNSATPVAVAGSLDFAMVSAGGSHTCGVTNYRDGPTPGGAVYCWGDNTYGQLGNSWTTSSSLPVNVAGAP
jgi:alpha-tubulin suppressor-like RCC1 family protein